mgnify:FL=1|tara:strand:- start:231 stop:515 length:285 start_codon:yes stop_codon:yes gene_type:complete
MNKERAFYWLTVLPLLGMLIYLHGEYKDQEAIIDRMHKMGNRQLEVMATSYAELVSLQAMRHMDEIIKIEEHHKQEIGECVEFYTQALEEAKKQ